MITFLDKTPDGLLYHRKVDDRNRVGTLEAGVYKMVMIDLGREYVPGYAPVVSDNDQPLEVDAKAVNLVKEIGQFLNNSAVFKKFGFSHKRGYLLHGPPGCGKSCTLRLAQKHFIKEFNGIVLIWNKTDFEEHLDSLRQYEPDRAVMVVCEDIDALLEKFEKTMLEVLDGQRGLNNFVLMATTNYLDQVPSRIKDRPSRIDRLVEIGLPELPAREKYLASIGLEPALVKKLASASNGLSIAKLKELVIATVCFDEPVKDVVKRLKTADMSVNQPDDDEESG